MALAVTKQTQQQSNKPKVAILKLAVIYTLCQNLRSLICERKNPRSFSRRR